MKVGDLIDELSKHDREMNVCVIEYEYDGDLNAMISIGELHIDEVEYDEDTQMLEISVREE